MVLFGVGEVLGCFFIGFTVDKFGSKASVLFNLSIITLMFGTTFLYIWDYSHFSCVFFGDSKIVQSIHTPKKCLASNSIQIQSPSQFSTFFNVSLALDSNS